MKHSFLLLSAVAIICSCDHKELIIPSPDVETRVLMELTISTGISTKALVKGTRLPDPSSVGITIRDPYGAYSGESYTNIQYTSHGESGKQVWESESPVLLSMQSGTVYSYYPYAEAFTDITNIPIRANSTVQTDFMWGTPVSVSKDSRQASIRMNHALAAVRITYVRGSYSGAGNVSNVSFGGSCIATGATLDATDGSLSNLTGKGAVVSPSQIATTLSTTLQEVELIVIPTEEKQGKIFITIDNKDYALEFEDIDLLQGQITQFHLTVNDGELSLSDITVSEWTYGESQGTVIKVTDKVTLTGDLENVAVHNSVTDGVVTIKAIPTSGEISFTEVEPVTFTGTAILTQSSDIDTGVRTITISDIESDVAVTFAGTIEYHVILKLNSEQGVANDMLGANVSPLWEQRQTLSRMDWNDQRILGHIVETGKYSTKYKQYTFTKSGTHTIKCLFRTNVITHNIFQSCDYFYARIGGKTQTVDYSAFMSCGLKELHLSEGIEAIESQAFYANSITNLTLPSTLSSFEGSIVNYCPYLSSITLPQTIEKLGKLFGTCQRLTFIACKSQTAPTLEAENIFENLPDNGVLLVPEGADYSTWMTSENLGGKNWTIVYKND